MVIRLAWASLKHLLRSLLYGVGGVRFETTEKTALAFSVQRLVDADLRGDQLAARWVFQAGVQLRFGGGEHPAHAD